MNLTSEIRQDAVSGSQGPIIALLAFIMGGLAFSWIVFDLTHTQILYGVVGCVFFFISFFSIRTGLILMAMSMLFSPEFSVGSIGIRSITIRVEDLLIPILALAWLAQSTLHRQWQVFVKTPLNLPIFSLIGLSLISTIKGVMTGWVVMLPGFFYIFKTVEYFTIFFLVVNYVRDEKQIKIFLYFILLTAFFLGLYTLRQVGSVEIFTEHRIAAPFDSTPQSGTVGGYMAFLLLIIFGLFIYETRAGMKWIYAVSGSILLVPFLFTLSRSSYMALIFGIIAVTLISRKKWVIFFVAGLLLSSPLWAPKSVKERVAFTWQDAKNPGRELGVDQSSQERFYAFRRMWITGKKSPIIGFGITSWQTPDSQWARTIHEIGFVGLWIWLWIFFRLFKMSYWLFRRLQSGIFKGLVLGYSAALLGILIHGFGSITLYIIRIMEPFWFISGLVVSLYLLETKKKHETPAP